MKYSIIILILILQGCNFPVKEEFIFTKSNKSKILAFKSDKNGIWGLSLDLKGEFNGEVECFLGETNKSFIKQINFKNGIVKLNFKMKDWYTDIFYLKIDQKAATNGKLDVNYTFHN